MESATFTHEGDVLHYVTAGSPDNPPVLMVHGYTSWHGVWRTTIPALVDDYYCVAIDLFGHGQSPIDPAGDYSIEAQGRRVLALADELGLERFTLIGHSMGGQIAMCIASMLAPERVTRLVDVAGVASARLTEVTTNTKFKPIRWLYGTPLGTLSEKVYRALSPGMRPVARFQFGVWFNNFDWAPFESWRADREIANRPGIRHTWYYGMLAIEGLDLTPHLLNIQAPTLVIFGAEDAVVRVSDGHLAAEKIPNSQLVLFEQCGHFPMYEKEADYLTAVRGFLL